MAMFPALMNDTMFSDLFDDPFFEGWRQTDNGGAMSAAMVNGMMRTDVKETKDGYDVDIDMPGFKKEDINLELSNGYLTVSARRDGSHEDKGEDVKESDIHASYKNGTLCLQVPKMDAKPQVEAKHQIAIEG